MFSTNSLLQGLGVMVCLGSFVLLGMVAIVARFLSNSQNGASYRNNRGPRQVFYTPPAIPADEDFGMVPTTGSVQDFERDYNADNVIGSSGFDSDQTTIPGQEDNPQEE